MSNQDTELLIRVREEIRDNQQLQLERLLARQQKGTDERPDRFDPNNHEIVVACTLT